MPRVPRTRRRRSEALKSEARRPRFEHRVQTGEGGATSKPSRGRAPAEAANDLAEGHISALEAARRRVRKAAEECARSPTRVARACAGSPSAADRQPKLLDAEDDASTVADLLRRDEGFERMDFETANDACGSTVAEMKMEPASRRPAAAAAEGLDIPERAAAYARAAEECAEEAKDVVDACLD